MLEKLWNIHTKMEMYKQYVGKKHSKIEMQTLEEQAHLQYESELVCTIGYSMLTNIWLWIEPGNPNQSDGIADLKQRRIWKFHAQISSVQWHNFQ